MKKKHTKKEIENFNKKKVRKINKKRRIIFNDVLNFTSCFRMGV